LGGDCAAIDFISLYTVGKDTPKIAGKVRGLDVKETHLFNQTVRFKPAMVVIHAIMPVAASEL